MTRELLELITDIRDFTTVFHVILRRQTSGRFIKTENIKCDVCRIILTSRKASVSTKLNISIVQFTCFACRRCIRCLLLCDRMSKQPRSWGLSHSRPILRGGWKKRDPGNEVGCQRTVIRNMAEQRIECVIFYVDPKSVGSLYFLGKERVRFPITNEHSSLVVFSKKFTDFAGLKAEAEKRGRKKTS